MRVLIVRIGAMGDVIHALPAVAALRELRPDWEIGWAIEPRWGELLQSSEDFDVHPNLPRNAGKPLIDRWHPVPTKSWKEHPLAWSTLSDINATRRELRMWQYDICVDMQGALKSAVVGRMAGARVFAGPAVPREAQAGWFYKQRIATSGVHVVEQGCELLGGAVGEVLRPAKVVFPVGAETEAWCDGVLAKTSPAGEGFVFIVPAAGWKAKEWPAERFGAVAASLGAAGYKVLVNEALGDRLSDSVVAASQGFATLVPCSLGQMVALTRRAALVIGGDTGPVHLAAALERPVVGIYGPTDPARNGPYGVGVNFAGRVLRDASSITSYSHVGGGDSGLLRIGVSEVVGAALQVLGEA